MLFVLGCFITLSLVLESNMFRLLVGLVCCLINAVGVSVSLFSALYVIHCGCQLV